MLKYLAPTAALLAGVSLGFTSIGVLSGAVLYAGFTLLGTDANTLNAKNPLDFHQSKKHHQEVDKEISDYMKLADSEDVASKKAYYEKLVQLYYNLATDFYEYGWGQSFHFAPRYKGEEFRQSIARAEHYVALRLGLKPGMKVLDLGAGVGGPMREIARFSGADIIGVNISKYQIERGTLHNKAYKLDDQCSFVEADFMKLPFEDNSIDAVYAIEATVHSPDREKLFKEIFRVLKKGGRFASYEWCVTKNYDSGNANHRKIKQDIELGNALPELCTTDASVEALKNAGFELVEATDFGVQTEKNPVSWYDKLQAKFSLSNFKSTKLGIFLTYVFVGLLEFIKIAPKGSAQTSLMLQTGADGLVRGGEINIFTPSFFIVGEKKAASSKQSSV